MMSVLALRLGGPLQSWGGSQRLERYRRTERFPSKSAVVGLVAAALGRSREDPIDDLTALRFGVRADRPGELLRDFHTVSSLFDDKGRFAPGDGRLPVAAGAGKYRSAATSIQVTERFYLADACFVAGLEGDDALLASLDAALARPVYPIYLGRRSCPPDRPVRLGVHAGGLLEVLSALPWQSGGGRMRSAPSVRCELVAEDLAGDRELIDEVRSFDPVRRAYARRRVRYQDVDVPNPEGTAKAGSDHDPMKLLEEG